MSAHQTVNDVLVGLFRDILLQEEKTLITDEFSDISCNDMHVIEAIGIEEPKNMSQIASKLRITVSTLTTSMNALFRKGYVVRTRDTSDRRVVFISLSDKGINAYKHHEEYHKRMTERIVASLTDEEIQVLIKALTGLSSYFELK